MKKNGFTLVELMVVIVIIGVALAIIVPIAQNIVSGNPPHTQTIRIVE